MTPAATTQPKPAPKVVLSAFGQRLVESVKAGYSVLAVQSPEVGRIETDIFRVLPQFERTVIRWTPTQGWMNAQQVKDRAQGTAAGPVAALNEFLKKDKKTVGVFHVFPEFFRDLMVRQLLRDVAVDGKIRGKVLILVGVFEMPVDLDKDITTVEYDLPTREELTALALALCKDNGIDAPKNGDLEKTVQSALGLTFGEAESAYSLSLVRNAALKPSAILEVKKDVVRKSGILEYIEVKEGPESVGGLDVLRAWATLRSRGFTAAARKFGLDPLKGVLLVGVPGCGKSLFAKVLSAIWGLPLLKLDMGRIFGSLVGQSEAQLRSALKTAEAIAPCILFIDEFEKATAGMGGSSTDGGTTQRVMGTLLTWLQDRPADKPVFVVATANKVEALPPEMLRKGRWDEVFGIDLPSQVEREAILRIHLKKRSRSLSDDAIAYLAERTKSFTGSEIEEVVKMALWQAFEGNERTVSAEDVEQAIGRTVPLSETMPAQVAAIREFIAKRAVNASKTEETGPGVSRRVEIG